MPLALKSDIPGGWLALWHITEATCELERLVTREDIESCRYMRNEGRRRQRLAWRAIVRRLLPGAGAIIYDDRGAPMPEGIAGHIGVSHCRDYAAVICRRQPCAIDIETADRNFSRVADRYISPAEASLAPQTSRSSSDGADMQRFRATVWCAKEALYKLSGRTGLSLLDDIRILSIDRAEEGGAKLMGMVVNAAGMAPGGTVGDISGVAAGEAISLNMFMHDDICIVYC